MQDLQQNFCFLKDKNICINSRTVILTKKKLSIFEIEQTDFPVNIYRV